MFCSRWATISIITRGHRAGTTAWTGTNGRPAGLAADPDRVRWRDRWTNSNSRKGGHRSGRRPRRVPAVARRQTRSATPCPRPVGSHRSRTSYWSNGTLARRSYHRPPVIPSGPNRCTSTQTPHAGTTNQRWVIGPRTTITAVVAWSGHPRPAAGRSVARMIAFMPSLRRPPAGSRGFFLRFPRWKTKWPIWRLPPKPSLRGLRGNRGNRSNHGNRDVIIDYFIFHFSFHFLHARVISKN